MTDTANPSAGPSDGPSDGLSAVLSEGLSAAADDRGRPLVTDVDQLLARAGRTYRRRRMAGGAAVVAAVAAVTAVALAVPSLGGGPTAGRGGDPAASPTTAADPVPAVDPPLTSREIVRRCGPQLEKFYALPQYAAARWQVAHPRDYRAGDLVLLDASTVRPESASLFPVGPNPVLCEVPEAGHESDPVPFERLELDADDPGRIAELCAETFVPQMSGGSVWTDLRGGQVRAVDRTGPVGTALLRVGEQHFACTLGPVTFDSGLGSVEPSGRGDLYLEGSTTGIKSVADDAAAYYYGAGLTDPDAVRLRITLADGQTFDRPVGSGGAWAVMLRVPGTGGLLDQTVEALDADGDVVASSPSS